MIAEPPKSRDSDELCYMCKCPKSEHTSEEMLACSKKNCKNLRKILQTEVE